MRGRGSRADGVPVVGGAVEVLDAHAEVESTREGLHLRLVSLDAHRLHLASAEGGVRVRVRVRVGLGVGLVDAHRPHLARAEGLEAHALGHDVLVGLPVALHAREHVAVCVGCTTSW